MKVKKKFPKPVYRWYTLGIFSHRGSFYRFDVKAERWRILCDGRSLSKSQVCDLLFDVYPYFRFNCANVRLLPKRVLCARLFGLVNFV